MIEVKIRFWTNNIADKKGMVRPKRAWGAGVVRVERNTAHGLAHGEPAPFNSMMELPWRIERLLKDHGIVLLVSDQERKYRRCRDQRS